MDGKETTIVLPDIHLTDLGKNENGITAADLTKRVLSAISAATVKAVSSTASNLGKSVMTGGVDKITKGIGGLFNK
jgi:hypothetical protein